MVHFWARVLDFATTRMLVSKRIPSHLSLFALASSLGLGGLASCKNKPEVEEVVEASPDLDWETCPDGFTSRCTTIEVPLDWEQPDGKKIDIFVSRRRAASGEPKRQLWLLQGGPGESGDVFGQYVEDLRDRDDDVEIFVLEHRGVGEGTRFECSKEEAWNDTEGFAITGAEWEDCIASLKNSWGDGLEAMNITNAAADLDHVTKLFKKSNQKSYVYGVSYGVLWTMRYLQLEPSFIDGVILDSIPAPGIQVLSDYDKQYDPVLKQMAEYCGADEHCRSKFGDKPWPAIKALWQRFEDGHCPELSSVERGLDPATLSAILSISSQIWGLRDFILPNLYRLDRCESVDVDRITIFANTLLQILSGGAPDDVPDGEPPRPRGSAPLHHHISFSELWSDDAPTSEEAAAVCDDRVLCLNAVASTADLYFDWPRYKRDEYAGKFPKTTVPVLSMNGELDPQTPWETARLVEEHLNDDFQTYVQVPFSPHGVVFSSLVFDPEAPACGAQMMEAFIIDPEEPIDDSCLDELIPLIFDAPPEFAQIMYGPDAIDLWENASGEVDPEEPETTTDTSTQEVPQLEETTGDVATQDTAVDDGNQGHGRGIAGRHGPSGASSKRVDQVKLKQAIRRAPSISLSNSIQTR